MLYLDKKSFAWKLPVLFILCCLIACNTDKMTDGLFLEEESAEDLFPVEIAVSSFGNSNQRSGTRAHIGHPQAGYEQYLGDSLSLSYVYSTTSPDNRWDIKWVRDSDIGVYYYWWQASEMGNPMMWKNHPTVDIHAYAPYIPGVPKTPVLTWFRRIPFAVQSDQSKGTLPSDFTACDSFSYTTPSNLAKLEIYLDHKLCELNIELVPGPTATVSQGQLDTLSNIVVGKVLYKILYNMALKPDASNYATDKVKTVGAGNTNAADSILIYPKYQHEDTMRSKAVCIIPPQKMAAGDTLVRINVNGKGYTFTLVRNFEFKGNRRYFLKLEVGDTALKLAEITIKEWVKEPEEVLILN